MNTLTAEPSPTLLDEKIDDAEHLISEGDLRRGAGLLEELRREALLQRDRDAMQRIADIASSARYLSRRHQGRFDRLQFIAEGNVEVLEGTPRSIPEPRAAGAGALVSAIVLHFVIGWAALMLSVFVIAAVYTDSYDPDGALLAIWGIAGAALWIAALGVIMWRWARFREDVGRLTQTSLGFLVCAPLAFIPLIYYVLNERGRRYVGLIRGPR